MRSLLPLAAACLALAALPLTQLPGTAAAAVPGSPVSGSVPRARQAVATGRRGRMGPFVILVENDYQP